MDAANVIRQRAENKEGIGRVVEWERLSAAKIGVGEHGAESMERRAWSGKQRAESKGLRAESRRVRSKGGKFNLS